MGRSWNHLKIDLYFTAQDIKNLLLDAARRKEILAYYRPLRLHKAYFEFAHPDLGIEKDDAMTPIVRDFGKAGITPAGALISQKGLRPLCYNDPDHLASLDRQSRRLARLFDEIIIDDWLFTVCACPRCMAAAGRRSWSDYRGALVPAMTRRHIVMAAKKVNPKVRIVIKFPNWWEGYHHNGYALSKQAAQFPAFCQGIETRGVATHNQHVPTYTGYFLQRWTDRLVPKKLESCWYDNWDMAAQSGEYIAQPYQGVLGGTREMVIWSAGTHFKSNPWSAVYPELLRQLPHLDRVAGMVPHRHTGIPTFIPYGSDGEYNLPGYFGMMGIPIDPTPVFPATGQSCILTLHAAKERSLARKILGRLESGGDVFMTWRLYERLKGTPLGRALQVVEVGGLVHPRHLRVVNRSMGRFSATQIPVEGSWPLTKIRLTTWPYACTIGAVTDDGDYGVLMSVRFLNGTLTVLNVPEDPANLLRLPAEALNAIRRTFMPHLHFSLETAANVACYQYRTDVVALYNMNGFETGARLVFDKPGSAAHWRDQLGTTELKVESAEQFSTVTLSLKPHALALLAPKKQPGMN